MNILATNFDTKSLLKYAFPTILMMIFMSTYTIVDGIFVANLVGEDALSAVNIVLPIINILLAIGLMFATGATAVMGKLMGEGKEKEARSFLSLLYLVAIILGVSITFVFLALPDTIIKLLGAKGELFAYAKDYMLSISIFSATFFLQVFVQSFFVLAGKPNLGFTICLAGGLVNIFLDYIFISPEFFDMGIKGAGFATGIGNSVPAIFGLLYFAFNKKGTLYFGKLVWNRKVLLQSIGNGMSELISQLSTAITTLLFNIILLDLMGKAGVASISVILYIQLIQTSIYFGYSVGVAPIISYKYGAQDIAQLKKVIKISFVFLSVVSLCTIASSLLFDDMAVSIFIHKSSSTFTIAKDGFRIFSIGYLFMGINVFASAMFTALSNGKVSALLSIVRTLVFLVASLVILPAMIGLNGVWLAVPVAELLAFVVSIYYYKQGKKVYFY